ncbi:MAG TPA: hypothetical protein VMU89_24470 [Thermomicrobiaceae bacterium]|nr:hypothetical protein [Thermomicrobiaceae bacterium]
MVDAVVLLLRDLLSQPEHSWVLPAAVGVAGLVRFLVDIRDEPDVLPIIGVPIGVVAFDAAMTGVVYPRRALRRGPRRPATWTPGGRARTGLP